MLGLRRLLRRATTPATFSFNSCPAPPTSFRLPSLFFFLLPWLNLRIQVALAKILYFERFRQLLANKKHSKSNGIFLFQVNKLVSYFNCDRKNDFVTTPRNRVKLQSKHIATRYIIYSGADTYSELALMDPYFVYWRCFLLLARCFNSTCNRTLSQPTFIITIFNCFACV